MADFSHRSSPGTQQQQPQQQTDSSPRLPIGCQLLLQQLNAKATPNLKDLTEANIRRFKSSASLAEPLTSASSLSKVMSSSSSSTCLQAIENAQAPADTASSAAHSDNTRNQRDTAFVQRCRQAGLVSTDLQELTALLVSLPDQTDAHKLYSLSAAQTVTPRRKTAMLAIGDEIELYRSDLDPLCWGSLCECFVLQAEQLHSCMLLCLLCSLLLCGLTKVCTTPHLAVHDKLVLAYIQTCFGKQRVYLRIYTYSTLVGEAYIQALMTIHAHCCLWPQLAVLCLAMFKLLVLNSLHHAQHALFAVTADRLTSSEHSQSCLGSPSICSTMSSWSMTKCRFLLDRASSYVMLRNYGRVVASGQLKKRCSGQKGQSASMQHEQSSHSMHAVLQAVSTLHSSNEHLVQFDNRLFLQSAELRIWPEGCMTVSASTAVVIL